MIKVAICDDDISVLTEFRELCYQYRTDRNLNMQCAVFCSSLEFMAELEKGVSYDAIFLDIIMPGQNGINTAKEIRKYDNNVKLIFLTSSDEFAVESYTVGAYFYQMKPISEHSFYQLMDSIVEQCKKEAENSLILRCKSGITKLDLDKLEYCEVIGRTLLFYMENGSVLERVGSMDEIWGQLMQYENFLRPHRSYIVNMEYIQTIFCKTIRMQNEAEIPIPHGKYTEIKTKYLDYAFSRKQTILL